MTAAEVRIPNGYKQTEVGVIPEDWEAVKVEDVCKLINGRGFKPFEWKNSGLPIIRIQNLNGSSQFNYFSGSFDPKLEIHIGQLLFAWSGSRGTSFGPHIWNGPFGLLNYHTWKVQQNDAKVTRDFLFHQLLQLTKSIEGWAHGASALVHVQKWQMEAFLIPLPTTLAEQQAIAQALGDADALIESLEQQIAKKRLLTQAAIQDLLTGKRRLASAKAKSFKRTEVGVIPEDWDIVQLRDAVTFLDGMRRPVKDADRARMQGDIPYYGASGIVDFVNDFLFDEDLILLGEDGENILSRNVPLAFKISGKTWVNNHAHVLRPNRLESIGFLTAFLESRNYEQYNSGTAQPKLNKATCSVIPLAWPSLAEQQAIADVLSDMDADIEATEAKLAKARLVKQGMMQELLTGRIRLV